MKGSLKSQSDFVKPVNRQIDQSIKCFNSNHSCDVLLNSQCLCDTLNVREILVSGHQQFYWYPPIMGRINHRITTLTTAINKSRIRMKTLPMVRQNGPRDKVFGSGPSVKIIWFPAWSPGFSLPDINTSVHRIQPSWKARGGKTRPEANSFIIPSYEKMNNHKFSNLFSLSIGKGWAFEKVSGLMKMSKRLLAQLPVNTSD